MKLCRKNYFKKRAESMENKVNVRQYSFDNLKGILIILVVLAHLLGVTTRGEVAESVYRLVYSFHMPVFIFLFGYFAKFNRKRFIKSFVIPYVAFQVLYILFENIVLNNQMKIQFTTPYWLMWYMLTCSYYMLLSQVYETDSKKQQLLILLFTIVISLVAGYDKGIGYGFSLSRTLVFQSWFVMGLYCRKNDDILQNISKPIKGLICILTIAVSLFICISPIKTEILYGAYYYESLGYTPAVRLVVSCCSLVWIIFFMGILKQVLSKKIPFLSSLGQKTFPVYLLHGFVVLLIGKYMPFLAANIFLAPVTAIIICILTGNKYTESIFKKLFS